MINKNEKILKQIYIEQTLKENRKYIGYRLDMIFCKIILTIVSFLVVYINSESPIFSILIGIQIFMILTLINKLILDSKSNKGQKIFKKRSQLSLFKNNLINNSNIEFERFLKLYLNYMRFRNVKKCDVDCYSAEQNKEKSLIKIYRFYEGALIERSDIRNLIQYIYDNKYEKVIVISLNSFSDEAKTLFEEYKEKLNIQLLETEDLFEFADKNSLLSTYIDLDKYLESYKDNKEKKKIVVSNFLLARKIIVYIFSAVLFYLLYTKLTHNILGLYISYYFIAIAVICILYNIVKALRTKKTI